jgi:serine protease AprX
MNSRSFVRSYRLSAVAVGMLASGMALANAEISPDLLQTLNTSLPTDQLTVVVSYQQSGPITAAQKTTLKSLGIQQGLTMRALPIAGVLATPAEIRQLAQQPDVVSIFPNRQLKYTNLESREITGAARVSDNPGDFNRAIPYSGKGVTVLVHDSGIDGTHQDLQFGPHIVQNTQAITNLHAYDDTLPITYIEGVPNTDISSGHGTHVAGIVGGTGARSNGKYRGVANGADLVGYGSGAAIAILDAIGGFDYAVVNQNSFRTPIRVITNSWGSTGTFDPNDPVNIADYIAYKHGMVITFAAGNDGPGEDTHNPYAQAPWVISVAAGEKNGNLTSFSSRGKRGESGTFTMPDGKQWTYYNNPVITAPGLNIISTRTFSGVVPATAAPDDVNMIEPQYIPFYTVLSGTSMATPHTAGIIALMLEANPNLTPLQVRDILERTATNMTGRLQWEAGAGYINAYAAVAAAQGLRTDYGKTVNSRSTFNSNALLAPGAAPIPFSIAFSPVGTVPDQSFTVGPEVAYVSATADIPDNTLALVLTDPDGERYGSAISLPELGSKVTVGAPAKVGTWKLTVRGIGSVSGNSVDPLHVTNGYGAPETITGTIGFLNSGGYTGLDDIANHPARKAIEFAVANRLVDGYSTHKFLPDQWINRAEMAQYLTMAASVRQSLPFNKVPTVGDVSTTSFAYPFVESVLAKAAPLRDLSQSFDGVMRLVNGGFSPNAGVSRLGLAYALVQSLALQNEARAFTGQLTVFVNGQRIPIDDASQIAPGDRGYVQYALDLSLINARFTVTQGPYDLQPTLHAFFDGGKAVTRADYAVAIDRYLTQYQSIAQ